MRNTRANRFGDLGDLGGSRGVEKDVRATVEQIAAAKRRTKICPTAREVSIYGSALKKKIVPEYLWENLARVVDLGYVEEVQDKDGEFRYQLTKKGEGLVYSKHTLRDGMGTKWFKIPSTQRVLYGEV